jgi:hypothetical protein
MSMDHAVRRVCFRVIRLACITTNEKVSSHHKCLGVRFQLPESGGKLAHPTVAHIPPLSKPQPHRVLFARVGWMTYYAGPQVGDERPKGGGSYNKEKVGHEVFNFADFGGQIYGFVQAQNGRINLERIDPAVGQRDKLDDVLVIFVATQKIIGWYQGATVHRTTTSFPASVAKEMSKRLKQAPTKPYKIKAYCFDIPTDKAVLLPTLERTHEIPGNVKGGFGQSYGCYLYQDSGVRKSAAWINDAVSYVLNYDKEVRTQTQRMSQTRLRLFLRNKQQAFNQTWQYATRSKTTAMLRTPVVLTVRGYQKFKYCQVQTVRLHV